MQISWIQICATLAGLLSHANPAVAVHLFPAGVESKSVGMASSLRAEGAPAVLYNPANLYLSKSKSAIDPYLELGMINVNYYYEHPQFDPVYVEVVSPTATVGYTHHFNDFVSAAGVVFLTLVALNRTLRERGFSGSDEDEAIANIAKTLEDGSDLDAQGAECTARELVEKHGVDGLIEKGLIDEDLMLVEDGNGDVDPKVLADVFASTFSCLWTTAPTE